METVILILILGLVIGLGIAGGLMVPIWLRTHTLLLELLQSIVGKVEDHEPFIYGAGEPPDEPPDASSLTEVITDAERQSLDNGTFRGEAIWEPPPDENRTNT